MKINTSFGLLACGLVLATSTGWAQTTPTGTVNSTTYPQGAIAPDSTSSKAKSRSQKQTMRQNRRTTNQNGQTNGTSSTSTQNARYQQSSASDGTAVNNSNTTNYNSNNATNPATGVGSNPNTTNVSTQSNQVGGQSNSSSMSTGSQTTTRETNSDAGSVEAIKGAKTSETPAVKAGSTVRNTSIGDFVSSSPNFTTLQNALQSSDLFETLKGGGSYTVFAPTNDAFKKLPTSVQAGLLDGSNKDALKQLLSYHVVSGTLNSEELSRQIKANNGKAQLKTLSGGTLTAKLEANGKMSLTDEQGKTVQVEGDGNSQANGMVYKIDSVLMPKSGATFR